MVRGGFPYSLHILELVLDLSNHCTAVGQCIVAWVTRVKDLKGHQLYIIIILHWLCDGLVEAALMGELKELKAATVQQ